MSRSAIVAAAVAVSLYGGIALAQQTKPQDTPPQDAPSQDAQPPQDQSQDTQPQDTQPQDTQPQDMPAPNTRTLADAVNAMIGAWELSNADHDKICHFNFRNDTVPGGYRVEIDKNCPSFFPSTKNITAWAVDTYGNLRLLDAGGNSVIDLTEVEGGMFDGFQPDEGRYVLQSAAAAVPVRSAEEMVGDWAIARGTGKPICVLTLANTAAAGGADNLALKLKPGCDPLVTRFGPTSWRMDNGELVLLALRGQSWRFDENDTNTWQRVPETPDPFLLVRQ